MPRINGDRLIGDLKRLADFGRYKTGVHRPTYSSDDIAARRWLCDRMAEIGLQPTIDGIGTVIGRSLATGRRLLLGSHLETQPYAGWLDGALGVIYGLEVARTFAETPSCAGFAVDVGAWADEEGNYDAMLGSRSYCGEITDDMLDGITNKIDGKPLKKALAEAGLASLPRERLQKKQYLGYLEAHVEQGDSLDSAGLRLGIVTGIVGIYLYRIIVHGQQNHAGTTRMAVRKDAGVAMMRLWHAIERRFPSVAGPRSVWTTGKVVVEPGSPSVIPGRAEMLFQLRDVEPERLAALEQALFDLVAAVNVEGPCRAEVEVISRTPPHAMATEFQDAFEQAAERLAPGLHIRMPSAAGHDAQVFARHIPAGMLFVPSIGGISHHYSEDTQEEDIVLGCQVFANAAEYLLRGAAGSTAAA